MYKALTGEVTPDSPVPAEPEEAAPAVGNVHDMYKNGPKKCPHQYWVHSLCPRCSGQVSEREVLHLPVGPQQNPDPSLYEEVAPYSALTVGMTVCRRIRPETKGKVTMIERMFQDSMMIKDVWVMFEGRSSATPYTPSELFRVRVQ